MANGPVNTPAGLSPDHQALGGTIRLAQYYIAAALAANIFRGSAVKPTGTSRQITAAAAADKIVGVFHGCNYVDAGGNTQFRPYWGSGQTVISGGLVEAQIYDDPGIIFSIQVSGAAGLVAANVGLLADLVIGTGNLLTGQSTDQIDQTTIGGSGSQFLIDDVDTQGQPPQSAFAYGQYAKALVRCAKHYLGPSLVAE